MPSQPHGHSATGRIVSMKNSNDTIGNRTRDLPVCRAVPQKTAPPRASQILHQYATNNTEFLVTFCILYKTAHKEIYIQSNHEIAEHGIEPPPSRSTHEICGHNYCYTGFRFTATLDIFPSPTFSRKFLWEKEWPSIGFWLYMAVIVIMLV